MTRLPRRLRGLATVALVSAAALVLSACAGAVAPRHGTDSIDYALPANFTPNWILPIGTAAHLNTNNSSISQALWEPLVAYDGSTGEIRWNKKGSVASAVDFAQDARSATITLADRTWSDGEPLTSRDVEFWFNIIRANKKSWGNYNEGRAPDNWTRLRVVDDRTFEITFDRVYNTQWMLANQFSLIRPLPQHAWDKTSDSGQVGDLDRTTAGARQVWKYLNQKAGNISGYATDPLWKTISGPYSVSRFTTSGSVTLSENPKYDGGEKAGIPTVNLVPFTTVDAEVNALRSGRIDYGYLSPSDLDQRKAFVEKGYRIAPWSGWAISYLPYNFNNPEMGAVFRQQYAREAVQRSIDQKGLAEVIFGGTAEQGFGPVPQGQASDFVSEIQKSNPYPYSIKEARALLRDHGWRANGDGIMVCERAGSGSGECGAGVERGTEFAMTVLSQAGSTVTDSMMSAIQSGLDEAGIRFSITTAPVNTVLSRTPPCTATQSICDWQLSFFGTAGSWYFSAYPTGDSLFQTGGGANFGSYSDQAVDELIDATTTSSDPGAIRDYSAALAQKLPVIWVPNPDYQVSVVRKGLGGFHQDSLANFHPQQWKWER